MTAQLLSLADAAARIGVAERTLRRHLGELRTYRIGRRRLVSVADLEVWVAGRVALPPTANGSHSTGPQLSEPAKRLLSRLECAQMVRSQPQRRGTAQRDPLTACQERGR